MCLFSHCSKQPENRPYLCSHLIGPGAAAAAAATAGNGSFSPTGAEVFASLASEEVGQPGVCNQRRSPGTPASDYLSEMGLSNVQSELR